jgi:hypothetical protein
MHRDSIYPSVAEGHPHFEVVFTNVAWGARLSMGQSKEKGKLFPIRKLKLEGKPDYKAGRQDRKGRGWTKYRGKPAANAPSVNGIDDTSW